MCQDPIPIRIRIQAKIRIRIRTDPGVFLPDPTFQLNVVKFDKFLIFKIYFNSVLLVLQTFYSIIL